MDGETYGAWISRGMTAVAVGAAGQTNGRFRPAVEEEKIAEPARPLPA